MFTSWFITKAQRKLFTVSLILINVSILTVGHHQLCVHLLCAAELRCQNMRAAQIDALIYTDASQNNTYRDQGFIRCM